MERSNQSFLVARLAGRAGFHFPEADDKKALSSVSTAHCFVRCRTEHSTAKRISLQEFHFLFIKETIMNINMSLAPLVSLLAGILILIVPRLLNYIVAAYLIVIGLLGLFGDIHLR